MKKKKSEEVQVDPLAWLEGDDPFGLNDPIELVNFVCTECKKNDEVPAYIIGEFMVDKKPGEPVTLECPYCNGEMFEAKDDPSE
ncbi:hypothetical protein CD30_19750 [Ureibacillus massiliensis 4400831 = CIP 108448 = CCUG 49529]|uniref:Uncharacterized protein n=1 Tax=Ureibacillus massiliensis 4400831 = CIP 108448 = CCUG 49529 TaxID=1211035 RepID=A0A0A3IA38_9BACL|nr:MULTISPECIES: hypothetical protein [Bacilli]KGR80300.1 hypothetical protein CD30_19750 [Ureibacillus massiliensis 4400831 = CIP 108448 = CCUG 49529]VGY73045.1 Uncharacterised protein [Streptococcus pyogenes]